MYLHRYHSKLLHCLRVYINFQHLLPQANGAVCILHLWEVFLLFLTRGVSTAASGALPAGSSEPSSAPNAPSAYDTSINHPVPYSPSPLTSLSEVTSHFTSHF